MPFSRLLQACHKLLCFCFPLVDKVVTGLWQGCHKVVTELSQGCCVFVSLSLTRLSQGCGRVVTGLWQALTRL